MSSDQQHSDNSDPRPQLIISAHDDYICAIKYLPNGRRVATGSSGDKVVKIWNLESGEQERPSMKHEGEVSCIATTRNGTKIVSSDGKGVVKVWARGRTNFSKTGLNGTQSVIKLLSRQMITVCWRPPEREGCG